MKVLVTGGTGFVSANIARRLMQLGHDIVLTGRNSPDDPMCRFLGELPGTMDFISADLRRREEVLHLVGAVRPARVVHAAALTPVPEDVERERFVEAVDINVVGTVNVLAALSRFDVDRLVYVSSGSVYGLRESLEPLAEDAARGPHRAVYPVTKVAAESLALRWADLNRLQVLTARLCSPFGPFERDTGSRPILSQIAGMVKAAIRGEIVRVTGPTDLPDDVAYVTDVADAVAGLLLAPSLHFREYNVGWGYASTLEEVMSALRQHLPETRFEVTGEATWNLSNRPRGPLICDRLMNDLGWRPTFNLASGLGDYIKWLQRNAE